MGRDISLTGVLRTFGEDEIIVSKTDLKGRITYCNKAFLQISGYTYTELMGQPHNILRHPDMPRSVFRMLWDIIGREKEIFVYVVNRCKNGDAYWVRAHVTPSYDPGGTLTGYHSNRRLPDMHIVNEIIKPMYQTLRAREDSVPGTRQGMEAGGRMMAEILSDKGMSYDEFIHSF